MPGLPARCQRTVGKDQADCSWSFGLHHSRLALLGGIGYFPAMSKLFLGLDSSTQSLSAVLIDLDTRKVVYEKSLNFDEALPEFKTIHGVLANRDPLVKHSSPRLWAAALDGLFARMKKDGVALGQILAVSGSGQQHGSVYLNESAPVALAGLDPRNPWKRIWTRVRPQDFTHLDGFFHGQRMLRNPQKAGRGQVHRLADRFGHV